MITCKEIKKVVEGVSGVKDISVKSRKGNLPQLRFIYFKLCKKYERPLRYPSLSKIGGFVKRDHATVLHGLKSFENDYQINYNATFDFYNECLEELRFIVPDIIAEELKERDLAQYYRVKSILMQEKYRSVISSLRNKLNKSREKVEVFEETIFLQKASQLNKEDLKELEEKFEVFFKVKQKLNNNGSTR